MRFRDPDRARRMLLVAIALGWLASVGFILGRPGEQPAPVVVVHWSNGHPAGDDSLLPAFVRRFNEGRYATVRGRPIQVDVRLVNSGRIEREIISRVRDGVPVLRALPDPTIVTPVTRHSLYRINQQLGRAVVDDAEAQSLATTWIGIATFKDMAECLGWPQRQIGYEDIIALAEDPMGWDRFPCARIEWGQRPLVAFTDPNSSSTGRSVLFTLYSIAAGKSPDQLTEADVSDERVKAYLRRFQEQVAHYVPDTLLLNCEIFGGPAYGHFFPIAEDNLVKLYKGRIVLTDPELERLFPCRQPTGTPIERDMVMIYPREGSAEHTHPAALVRASWVSADQAEGARRWIDFLHEESQQAAFMAAGFRPTGGGLSVQCPVCRQNGIDPAGPRVRIDPDRMPPAVGGRIVGDWGDIKKPGVGVFVIDNSLAMVGATLDRVAQAVAKAIDDMYDRNSVGVISVAGTIRNRVDPQPVPENRAQLATALQQMQVANGSVMFEAIGQALTAAARAPAADKSVRAVVVLAGAPANAGMPLHELVEMASVGGRPILNCTGFEGTQSCLDAGGEQVDLRRVKGVRLREGFPSIPVYFIGIGESADAEAGRILAEATKSYFVRSSVDDLATVIGVLKGYF